jgi:rSAM/selenodomain-associated transferase 1
MRRLVVMTRWPAPGRCKRRLAAGCGALAAAQMQAALNQHTLTCARLGAGRAAAELWLAADGIGPRALRRWASSLGVNHWMPQGGGGLGCRLQRQLQRAFTAGAEQVVLIGSDLPQLEAQDLERAFQSLQQWPLVLGPASDGGYWLIGLQRSAFQQAGARLTAGMPWGGPAVLECTLRQAAALGLEPLLLRQQSDLDQRVDLAPWQGRCR